DVVEDIPVDVPNIFPTHPALLIDFDFIPSNYLGSDLDNSSPSRDRNKICDPRICIEVESMRILAPLPLAKRSRNSRRTKNDRVKYELDAKQGLVGNLKSSCTRYSLKDINEAKPDKTEHEIEKSAKNRGQRNKTKDSKVRIEFLEAKKFQGPGSCFVTSHNENTTSTQLKNFAAYKWERRQKLEE
ncbi:hypothetical protein Tco_1350802, partial [Tanacetum coccineum]